jgi:hypothetical protein
MAEAVFHSTLTYNIEIYHFLSTLSTRTRRDQSPFLSHYSINKRAKISPFPEQQRWSQEETLSKQQQHVGAKTEAKQRGKSIILLHCFEVRRR